ncbi:MAG: carbohydrate binding family 9 domain-containing protein [Candidatus Zixiibacteriota bacterium]|nr:MAG: carbohydrate binding family 9 domain-containing protein [candidate division Zixibacteria bacterium]
MCTFHVRGAVAALITVTFLAGASLAEPVITNSSWQAQYHPTLEVKRAPGKIKIDGDLSDPGWREAQPAQNFTQHHPNQETAPPVRTEAFMTYDDENVYFAAVCYAPAGTVRASLCERERIFNDDNIGFFFDTYGDATRAYIINLNPYGIPYDALWSRGWGEDGSFDLIFESSGVVTDSGYQVEMAIPYSSLRFPNKPVQEWRVDFYRHHQRESHYSMSWATYDLNEQCWPCRWGTVTGIENVSPGKGFELMPTFVSHQTGTLSDWSDPETSLSNGDLYGETSLSAKYNVSSDLTVEATYNPDFSQVESDATQIDVNSTFALYYNERRPFFQEGIDLFRTNFNMVHTRTINKPKFASKFSGRFGSLRIAGLTAYDDNTQILIPMEESSTWAMAGKNLTNMFAARQTLGDNSDVRLVVTDRRIDGGGSGTAVSLDGGLTLGRQNQLRWQYIATHTEEIPGEMIDPHWDYDTVMEDDGVTIKSVDSTWIEPTYFDNGRHTAEMDGETFYGHGFLVGLNRHTPNWWSGFTYYERTPTYRAANGHQPQNSDRRVYLNGGYNFRFETGLLERFSPNMDVGRIWNFDGLRKDEWLRANLNTNFRFAQTYFGLGGLFFSNERLGGRDYRGIWAVTPSLGMTPSSAVDFGIHMTYGKQIARGYGMFGRLTSWGAGLDVRPTERLMVSTSFHHSQSIADEPFEVEEQNGDTVTVFNARLWKGYTARVRLNYQFSRELNLRLISQYNSFSEKFEFDPLITYRINPFSIFYIGTTMDYNNCDIQYTNGHECRDRRLTHRQFFMKLQYLFQI